MKLKDKIEILERQLIKDERGWFLKAITGDEDNLPAFTGEVYLTNAKPGQMKGGHYHAEASEWFTMVSGKALCKLSDIESGETMEIELCFDDALTIYVPRMVAHSFVNNGPSDFILLAYSDRKYTPEDTIPYIIH